MILRSPKISFSFVYMPNIINTTFISTIDKDFWEWSSRDFFVAGWKQGIVSVLSLSELHLSPSTIKKRISLMAVNWTLLWFSVNNLSGFMGLFTRSPIASPTKYSADRNNGRPASSSLAPHPGRSHHGDWCTWPHLRWTQLNKTDSISCMSFKPCVTKLQCSRLFAAEKGKLKKHYVTPDSYQVTWWTGEKSTSNINSESTTGQQYRISRRFMWSKWVADEIPNIVEMTYLSCMILEGCVVCRQSVVVDQSVSEYGLQCRCGGKKDA